MPIYRGGGPKELSLLLDLALGGATLCPVSLQPSCLVHFTRRSSACIREGYWEAWERTVVYSGASLQGTSCPFVPYRDSAASI